MVNSHNVVGIMHKLNIIYFYSLCRFLMTNLSEEYAPDFHADVPSEKFNQVMRGASYEKFMTSVHLKEIKKECTKFDVSIHEVVELFHSLLNKTTYSYELSQETEYDCFCQTLFPNRFEILDDFSRIELQFVEEVLYVEEDPCVEEDSNIMDTSITKVFNDPYHGDGRESEIISQSLNDTMNTVDEGSVIHSNTSGSNNFQEGLELAFNEYKSLEGKYVLLQKDYHSLQDKHNDLLLQIEHMNECLNQQNEEFVDLKEAYTSLQEDKVKQDNKLKEFMSSLGI